MDLFTSLCIMALFIDRILCNKVGEIFLFKFLIFWIIMNIKMILSDISTLFVLKTVVEIIYFLK